MNYRRLKFVFIFSLLLTACMRDKNPVTNGPQDEDKRILLLVIENNNSMSSAASTAFQLFRMSFLNILGDIFNVPASDMNYLDLTEIIDLYGEEWQIDSIKDMAGPFYDSIIALTDSTATFSDFLEQLSLFHHKHYVIDVVMNLHADSTHVVFFDGPQKINNVTGYIADNGISIHSIYQTCCFGSYMIDEWEQIGVCAVNGAAAVNSYAMFSPIYFVQAWLNGATFDQAVNTAMIQEIQKIESYKEQLPAIEYLLQDQIKADSQQKVGGTNPQLNWRVGT